MQSQLVAGNLPTSYGLNVFGNEKFHIYPSLQSQPYEFVYQECGVNLRNIQDILPRSDLHAEEAVAAKNRYAVSPLQDFLVY